MKCGWRQHIWQQMLLHLCENLHNSKEISVQVTLLFVDLRYLEVEWEVKRKTHREFSKTNMVDLCPKVPKQDNSSDCGVYLLQYVESFFKVCKDVNKFFIHSC